MTMTLRVNARNDLHLPSSLLRSLNLGQERMLKAELKGSILVLIPVDLKPRGSSTDLPKLVHLSSDEKKRDKQIWRELLGVAQRVKWDEVSAVDEIRQQRSRV